MPERLIHDAAFAVAWRMLELVRSLIREEEQRDFVEEGYLLARQEIERMLAARERQEARLHPTDQHRDS
jgi:hypothetical protein